MGNFYVVLGENSTILVLILIFYNFYLAKNFFAYIFAKQIQEIAIQYNK